MNNNLYQKNDFGIKSIERKPIMNVSGANNFKLYHDFYFEFVLLIIYYLYLYLEI